MVLQSKLLALFLALCMSATGSLGALFPEEDPSGLLVLVNREHRISKKYVPELVLPNVAPSSPSKADAIYLRPEAAGPLEALFQAAAEAGYTLYAVSGYRSYGIQASIYNRKVEAVGEKRAQLTSAPPGASEHQLGLAMDINGETTVSLGLVEAFGESPEGVWVAENAHRFGFIIRYPKGATEITGYAYEPWHLRYVGTETAQQVYELGITYEEYHGLLQAARIESWGKGDSSQ